MLGYDRIKNMPDTEISKTFEVSIQEAVKIRNSTIEEMAAHPGVCKGKLGFKGECYNDLTSCNRCTKEFLKNELPM